MDRTAPPEKKTGKPQMAEGKEQAAKAEKAPDTKKQEGKKTEKPKRFGMLQGERKQAGEQKKPEQTQKQQKEKAGKGQEKPEFDPWSVLRYPHLAEKSMKVVEAENKLVFIVDRRAGKDLIAAAVEREFNVAVVQVNTEITSKGLKKAYVKLDKQHSAGDIATRLGMI